MTKRKSVYIFLSTAVLLVLLLPFLALTLYNNPSIDDYAFGYYTETLGLFGAQVMWYTQWTGRYASMFLLSLHPLVVDSIWLYKLISAFMIFFSGHAIYLFAKHVMGIKRVLPTLLTALLGLYVFMNTMPTLVQGFYWEPGAVVYQLGNILALYFLVSIFKTATATNEEKLSLLRILRNSAIVIVACGLSETGMVLMFLIALFNFLLPWIAKRKPKTEAVIYLVLAVVCSTIVFLAPGNYIRGDFGTGDGESFALKAIFLSLSAAAQHALSWMLSVEWILYTLLLVLLLSRFGSTTQSKQPIFRLGLFFLVGMGVVAATFTPGFYATKILAPERVVNVSYWAFVIFWMGFITVAHPHVLRFTKNLTEARSDAFILASCLLLLVAIDKEDNAYAAGSDLLSGRAAQHNREFMEREALVGACSEDVCYIPSYTVFPKSVFNEDMADYYDDSNLWWYGHHHGKGVVKGQFRAPEQGFHRVIDFKPGGDQNLKNLNSVVDSLSHSGTFSSYVKPIEGFSATLKLKMGELDVPNIYALGRGRISAKVLITEANCAADLVFVITRPGKADAVYWRGGPIDCSPDNVSHWQDVTMRFPLEKRYIDPNYDIAVYLWNHGPSEMYLDDLDVWLY